MSCYLFLGKGEGTAVVLYIGKGEDRGVVLPVSRYRRGYSRGGVYR